MESCDDPSASSSSLAPGFPGTASGLILFSSAVIQVRTFLSAGQATKAPPQAEAIYAQGMQALQQGDLSAAETAFKKVLRLAPGSAEAHNSLGWVLLAQEKTGPAIREFQVAVKRKPDFPQAPRKLGRCPCCASGNPEGAIREAKEARTTLGSIRFRRSPHACAGIRIYA